MAIATGMKMKRRKAKAKRDERIAERQRAATLASYAQRKTEIRETFAMREGLAMAGLTENSSGNVLTFSRSGSRILESNTPRALPPTTQGTNRMRNAFNNHIVRDANAENGAATAAPAGNDDDTNDFESDLDLSFDALVTAISEFQQDTLLSNVNWEEPNVVGKFAIVPIVVGRGADRAVKYNAIVETPTFDEMLLNNPDFFRQGYGDMIEGRIARGVRAFASNRSTVYDLPSIVRNEDGAIDLSSWNEVRRRVGRVGVDKSWAQIAKAMCESLKKLNFPITPRDLRSALSNAEMAQALFPRMTQEHWIKILDVSIGMATKMQMPTKYMEQWKETRTAKKASTSATFDIGDL